MARPYSLILTGPARDDLSRIRAYTVETYGTAAADAYDALLRQTLRDIRDDPFRPGSQERPEIGEAIFSFHSVLSRRRSGLNVKSPRHFVLYFLPNESTVAISRVLHEARDLARHIPELHREQARMANEELNFGYKKDKPREG